MYIKNQLYSGIFKLLIALTVFIGYGYNSGMMNGDFHLDSLLYYTNLSNILIGCFMLYSGILILKNAIQHGKDSYKEVLPRFKGALVIAILVTGLIYDFILAPKAGPEKAFKIGSILLHYVVPYVTLIDWFAFDKKGYFKKQDSVLWIVIPYIYLIFIMIFAQFKIVTLEGNSFYPYFFLDIDTLGIFGVFLYIVGLTVIFLVLNYALYLLDRILAKKGKQKGYSIE